MGETKQARADKANELLTVIASCGRHFFAHKGRISRFELDDRGRIWFVDKLSGARLYTHYRYWSSSCHFSEGGTLGTLCSDLRDYIRTGSAIHPHRLGPWPEWCCGDGDLWGYGDDMEQVRDSARKLGITQGADHA